MGREAGTREGEEGQRVRWQAAAGLFRKGARAVFSLATLVLADRCAKALIQELPGIIYWRHNHIYSGCRKDTRHVRVCMSGPDRKGTGPQSCSTSEPGRRCRPADWVRF